VLADIAASVGLDGASARAVLTDGRFAEAVRQEEAFWTSRGITGVPAMVFDQRYLVTGAHGVENYTRVLREVSEEIAA
jgi:predicted DsbA family dithiol-disulfide isomerase